MRRAALFLAVLALMAAYLVPAWGPARAASFQIMHFQNDKEFTIKCPFGLECTVKLEPGERYNDAFSAQAQAWDPHMAYQGGKALVQPLLILRPSGTAQRTNVVLTTTRRTYYLLLVPIHQTDPMYYSFQYDETTYRSLADQAIATQTALRAQNAINANPPTPTPTPADVADLHTACTDFDYTYVIARYLPDDHPHNAKSSSDPYPGTWKPQIVCSDGQHTYIQVAPGAQAPVDLPAVFAITPEGDTVINSTFNAARWRYVVDGVYDKFVLEVGSQYRPLRMVIAHHNKDGVVPEQQGRHATPIPIIPPAPVSVAPSAAPSPLPSAPSPAANLPVTTNVPPVVAVTSATIAPRLASSVPSATSAAAVVVASPTPSPIGSPSAQPRRVAARQTAPVSSAHPKKWLFGGKHLLWPTRRSRDQSSYVRRAAVTDLALRPADQRRPKTAAVTGKR